MNTDDVEACSSEDGDVEQLLSGSLKTATPYDIIVQVTAECAIWTQVLVADEVAKGPTVAEAQATITVWPEIWQNPSPATWLTDAIQE